MAERRTLRQIERDLAGLIKQRHQVDRDIQGHLAAAVELIPHHDHLVESILDLVKERDQYRNEPVKPSHL